MSEETNVRRRRAAVWTLLVLGTIVAVLAALTTWVHRQALDNSEWRRTSARLIDDPVIRRALATQLVDELYANIDIASQLQQRLPKGYKQLSGPAAAALRDPATRGVAFMLSRQHFRKLFVRASAVGHAQLVDVLENKSGHGISTGNGVVTVDATQLLREIGGQLGFPSAVLDRLPPDAGTITVMRSDQLGVAQKAVQAIRILSVWLLVLVFALYGVAIYLAAGSRRRTLIRAGWGLVIAGLVTLVLRHFGGDYVVGKLAGDQHRRPAQHVWSIGTSTLGQIGWATVLYGLVTVLGGLLAGPTPVAAACRREAAPLLNRRPAVAGGAVAALYLLLVLWGPTHALRTWWGVLLLGALLAAGFVVIRRQCLAEFPDAGLEVLPSLRSRVAESVRSARTSPSETSAVRPLSDELERLAALRDRGVISAEEFEVAKRVALSGV